MTQNVINQPYQSTKGDIMGGTGTRPAILPVGANGTILTADSTQTTGLKWTTTPAPGGLVQQAYNSTNSFVAVATSIPYDDTIPQITEGTQILTCSITPTSATNLLMIEFSGFIFNQGQLPGCVALFQDATANALNAVSVAIQDTGAASEIWNTTFLRFRKVSGTTSAITFRIRIGVGSLGNQISLNGNSSRKYGGAATASLTVWEIAV